MLKKDNRKTRKKAYEGTHRLPHWSSNATHPLVTTFESTGAGEYPLGFSYSREDNPNRRMLEECLPALEGGKEALMFSSGLAVLTGLIHGLEAGDHIIAPGDVHYGLRQVVQTVFAKWPLDVSYVEMTNLGAIVWYLRHPACSVTTVAGRACSNPSPSGRVILAG